MFIQQISIFIENKKNRLAELTELLGAKSVNLHALSIADTTDFGVVRLIVEDVAGAVAVLKEADVVAKTTDVLAVRLQNQPGSLAKLLSTLTGLDISIEYMYAFAGRFAENEAIVVLRLENQDMAAAKLKDSGLDFLSSLQAL